MKTITDLLTTQLQSQTFSSLAYGRIDFEKKTFETHEVHFTPLPEGCYFDLASLTKPLTLGAYHLMNPSIFQKNPELLLLLEHRAGITSGGRLSSSDWKENLLRFPIKESATLYSDYSILRLQLEVEEREGKSLKEIVSSFWDNELCFWLDLPANSHSPKTGDRQGKEIRGAVHDDNCFYLKTFTAHAGLFATVKGLCQTLLNMNSTFQLISRMNEEFSNRKLPQRFLRGFDTVENPKETLAGAGCSPRTIGHTGFTGTSFWIDLEKKLGWVLLTNATERYWHDRANLNNLRRMVGERVWGGQ